MFVQSNYKLFASSSSLEMPSCLTQQDGKNSLLLETFSSSLLLPTKEEVFSMISTKTFHSLFPSVNSMVYKLSLVLFHRNTGVSPRKGMVKEEAKGRACDHDF